MVTKKAHFHVTENIEGFEIKFKKVKLKLISIHCLALIAVAFSCSILSHL